MKIEYKGIEFDVEFYHQPYEPEVRYYSDESGYPGCAESVELEEIKHKGTCFLEFFQYEKEEIEELIIENL